MRGWSDPSALGVFVIAVALLLAADTSGALRLPPLNVHGPLTPSGIRVTAAPGALCLVVAGGDLRCRWSATRDGTLQLRTEGIEESASGHSEFGQQPGVRVAVQVDPIGQTPGQGLGSVGSVGTAEYLECLSLRENSHRASFRDDVVECPRCSPAGRHRPRPPHSTTRHGWCELPERRRAATGWLSTRSIRHAVAGAAASGMVLLPVGNVRSGHFVPIADLRSPGFGLRPAHLERAHACHSSPRRHR
jgi:hypothetical protein